MCHLFWKLEFLCRLDSRMYSSGWYLLNVTSIHRTHFQAICSFEGVRQRGDQSNVDRRGKLLLRAGGVLYLGHSLRSADLSPGYPPGQRAGAAPPQVSRFGLLGRDEFNQLHEQPVHQLRLPLWAHALLPLQ